MTTTMTAADDDDVTTNDKTTILFYHPYCSGGGGGERVLWKMIHVLQQQAQQQQAQQAQPQPQPQQQAQAQQQAQQQAQAQQQQQAQQQAQALEIIIFTIDEFTKEYKSTVLNHVYERFGIRILEDNNTDEALFQLNFIHLHSYKYLLQPSPYLSMIVESYHTMLLAYYGVQQYKAQTQQHTANNKLVFIDTTGCVFTYIPAKLCLHNCLVVAYVHYPTISTDMLQRVYKKRYESNNATSVPFKSLLYSYIKVFYYIGFAILYGIVGSCFCNVVMVNSTWTFSHIQYLWKLHHSNIHIVYPPCSLPTATETASNEKVVSNKCRENVIVSIGQFRPEKDHELQLFAFAQVQQKIQVYNNNTANTKIPIACRLVIIGSCRQTNTVDTQRLEYLRNLTVKLQISDSVTFVVNQPYDVVLHWFKTASIGYHTMWNEHFGIGVVEMMAAGLVVVAHDSGGPASDIVVPLRDNTSSKNICTGYLATSITDYADVTSNILVKSSNSDNDDEIQQIRCNAMESSKRFTDDVFEQSFYQIIQHHI